jgi:hypothetical protein
MKLTESKLRRIIQEELSKLSEDPREAERIYNEITDYLERHGRSVSDGWEIEGIRVGLQGREPIRVKWGHTGETGRWIGGLEIGPNGEIAHTGVGGAGTYERYYEDPEQIIDILQGDKKTAMNYPT